LQAQIEAWGLALGPILEAHATGGVARDDILDAMAACWTAERIVSGEALCLPDDPPRDARGLRMEILR
jgi:predicted RNase H-like nuclease